MTLTLERRAQADTTVCVGRLVMTPSVGADYWAYRVRLTDTQAIIGFPKFFTIGIGFAVEDADWNANLPYTCSAAEIYEHIAHNSGDPAITREACIEAIELIRGAAASDRGDS